jgi:hypothetical protein
VESAVAFEKIEDVGVDLLAGLEKGAPWIRLIRGRRHLYDCKPLCEVLLGD